MPCKDDVVVSGDRPRSNEAGVMARPSFTCEGCGMNIFFDMDYTLLGLDGSLRPNSREVMQRLNPNPPKEGVGSVS